MYVVIVVVVGDSLFVNASLSVLVQSLPALGGGQFVYEPTRK